MAVDSSRSLGFRKDGRLVVRAGDAVFALHVGPGDVEPELVVFDVPGAWLVDGEVRWLGKGDDRPTVPPPTTPRPDELVELVQGRAVFR